jgi:hypothetical protein
MLIHETNSHLATDCKCGCVCGRGGEVGVQPHHTYTHARTHTHRQSHGPSTTLTCLLKAQAVVSLKRKDRSYIFITQHALPNP